MKDFMDFVRKSAEYDGWVEKTGIRGYCSEIQGEAEEAIQAIDKEDMDNLKEELGDVFYDWAHAAVLAERRGLFTVKEIVDAALEKFNHRKPYVKEGTYTTAEESVRIWNQKK